MTGGRPAPRAAAADPGLCGRCRHAVVVVGARSEFVRCGLAAVDARFARYPSLPVRECEGFEVPQGGGETDAPGG